MVRDVKFIPVCSNSGIIDFSSGFWSGFQIKRENDFKGNQWLLIILYVIFISNCSEILERYVDRHEHMSRGYTLNSRSYRLSRTCVCHEPICRDYPTPLLKPGHHRKYENVSQKFWVKIKKIYGQTGLRSQIGSW